MGPDRYRNAIVGSGKEEMGMTRLSADTKNMITEILNAACSTQNGFTVKYDDENNPMVAITFSSRPEYQFAICSTDDFNAFTTSECPGIHSDEAEAFQRSNFELCVNAIKEWVGRIIDNERDWILDEFGGVADSDPAYGQGGKNH